MRASDIGRPLSRQFLPEDYHGFEQVWDFAQTSDGLIYASNYGALREFDGRAWRTIPLPTSWVFKVTAAPGDRLFIAGFDELGFVERLADGRREYRSLVPAVPAEALPLGQVNGCVRFGDAIFWSTPKHVLRWDGAAMKAWAVTAPSQLRVHATPDALYLEGGAELWRYDPGAGAWTVASREPAVAERVVRILGAWAGAGPVIVRRDGRIDRLDAAGVITRLPTALDTESRTLRVMGATVLADGRLALATTGQGLIVLAPDGGVDLAFGTRGGVGSPDLHVAFEDREHGVWLGSDLGLARLERSSSVSIYDRDNGAPLGVCYTIFRRDGVLYGAGNDGLYRLTPGGGLTPAHFEKIPGADFTVNMHAAHRAGVVLATDSGLVRFDGARFVTEFEHSPALHFVGLSSSDPDLAFISDSHGLSTARWNGSAWRPTGDTVAAQIDVRSLAEDREGALWIGTPTRGAARLTRRAGAAPGDWRAAIVTPFDVTRGLPAGHEWTTVRDTPHGIVFVHARGVSVYDPATERLISAGAFDSVGKNGRYIYAFACDAAGAMWVQIGDPTRGDRPELGGVAPVSGGGWKWIPLPGRILDALGYLGAQELIWEPAAGGAGALWLPGQKNLVRVDLDLAARERGPVAPSTLLRDVTLGHDLRLPLGGDGAGPAVVLDYSREALRFHFAAPSFAAGGAVEFQSRLVGFDDAWSPWSARDEATYTNLSGRRFAFEVRARVEGGAPGPVARWVFSVRPPWWFSEFAFAGYALAAILAVTGLVRWRLGSARRAYERLEHIVSERTNELARERDRAEDASQAKTMFLARMSHELRTPLHPILGYSRLLAADPTVPAPARDRLRIVRASGLHLLRLINEVLDLSKIEAGKQELAAEPFDLDALLHEVCDAQEARAALKGLIFRRPEPAPVRHVLGDAPKLRQVLENLLGNATKFTAHGEVELLVSPGAGEAQVRFAVRDTGPGLDAGERARLFQPFAQMRAGERAAEAGTGLGLAIAHRLVALMGGRLEVESAPGRGATFFFTVRLPAVAMVPREPDRRERVIEGYEGPRRHVLAVDDVEANRALFVDLLAPLGFSVATAKTAEEALDKLERQRPDLLLLDLRLPGMDGFELARRVRSDRRLEGMKILAASASVLGHDPREALAAGCDGFIPKPFLEDEFLARVGDLLGLTWRERTASVPVDSVPLDAALVDELRIAARAGDVVGLRAVVGRMRDRHGPGGRVAELEAALRDFDLDHLVRLADSIGTASHA